MQEAFRRVDNLRPLKRLKLNATGLHICISRPPFPVNTWTKHESCHTNVIVGPNHPQMAYQNVTISNNLK